MNFPVLYFRAVRPMESIEETRARVIREIHEMRELLTKAGLFQSYDIIKF
jgi:hypothetical protein